MVVEWRRECYQSRWFFFKDSAAAYTVGRYYFSPPEALHFPGTHLWGSRDWQEKNWTRVQGLGEDLAARHRHASGQFDGVLPEQRFAGSLACASSGEAIQDAAQDGTLFNGYPEVCYIPLQPVPPPNPPPPPTTEPLEGYNLGSAFFRCQVQRLWATVIAWLYDDRQGDITTLLRAFFGSSVDIIYHSREGDYPRMVVIARPDWVIVAVEGTTTYQQFAMQAFRSLRGPQDFGYASTNRIWQDAAFHLHWNLLLDGINDIRPIFLAGHSYGGVASLILAAMYRFGHPTRTIKYITYGVPKIGDERLARLIRRCDGISLANDNDFVTSCPPDRVTTAPLVAMFPLLNFAVLGGWERPEGTTIMDSDGVLTPGPPLFMDFATVFAMVQKIVTLQPFDPIEAHSITEYARRIGVRCPNAGWPVDQEVVDLIGGGEVDGEPGLLAGAEWPPDHAAGGAVLGGDDVAPELAGGAVLGGDDVAPELAGGAVLGGNDVAPELAGGAVLGDG